MSSTIKYLLNMQFVKAIKGTLGVDKQIISQLSACPASHGKVFRD